MYIYILYIYIYIYIRIYYFDNIYIIYIYIYNILYIMHWHMANFCPFNFKQNLSLRYINNNCNIK